MSIPNNAKYRRALADMQRGVTAPTGEIAHFQRLVMGGAYPRAVKYDSAVSLVGTGVVTDAAKLDAAGDASIHAGANSGEGGAAAGLMEPIDLIGLSDLIFVPGVGYPLSINLDSLGGLDAVKKVDFAGLVNLAIGHDFHQEATQLVAAATISLDTVDGLQADGLTRFFSLFPLAAVVHANYFTGGDVFGASSDISTGAGSSLEGTNSIPTALSISIQNLLGFALTRNANLAAALGQKATATSAAGKILESSLVLGLAQRLASAPSTSLPAAVAMAISSTISGHMRFSPLAAAIIHSGLSLDISPLVGKAATAFLSSGLTSQATATTSPKAGIATAVRGGVGDAVSGDLAAKPTIAAKQGAAAASQGVFIRPIQLAARESIQARSHLFAQALATFGVDMDVAVHVTNLLKEAVSLASQASVTDEVRLRATLQIALSMEQLADLENVLVMTGHLPLRSGSKLEGAVTGNLIGIANYAMALKAMFRNTGEIHEEALLALAANCSDLSRLVIGSSIALNAQASINPLVEHFKQASISLGMKPAAVAASVANFRDSIVAAIISRLEIQNFNPQVIRIVSELLSQSAVTDEGFTVSRIAEETITRAD